MALADRKADRERKREREIRRGMERERLAVWLSTRLYCIMDRNYCIRSVQGSHENINNIYSRKYQIVVLKRFTQYYNLSYDTASLY